MIRSPSDSDWLLVRNNALFTRRKSSSTVPSSKLKLKLLASEHSPIYNLEYIWEWLNLPYWVSVHFVRHNIGITHFVSTQRNDMQDNYDRRKAPQDSLVNHRCVANASAIMSISRKRLCLTASNETRYSWELFLDELDTVSPELRELCVKPCIYRSGTCPEVFSDCRYNETKKFKKEVKEYNNLFLDLKNG